MRVRIHIPTTLRQYSAGNALVELDAITVRDSLDNLVFRFPDMRCYLFSHDDNSMIRRFISVYHNDEEVRTAEELAAPVKNGDEICIIPAVAS